MTTAAGIELLLCVLFVGWIGILFDFLLKINFFFYFEFTMNCRIWLGINHNYIYFLGFLWTHYTSPSGGLF